MEVTKRIQIKILETKKYNFCNEKIHSIGTRSRLDNTEEKIINLRHCHRHSLKQNICREKKKNLKMKGAISELHDNVKWPKTCIIRIPKEKKGGQNKYLNK